MSISEFPDEILQNIFCRLPGVDVVRCREASRRWRDAVDSLPDSGWRQICQHDSLREDYSAARDKYGLSWRDTYKALNSWSENQIRSANFNLHKIKILNVQSFKVLPNGVLACLQNKRNKSQRKEGYSDTIVYYNLETSKHCGIEEFDFVFSSLQFDENAYFRVLILDDGRLCLVVKSNNKRVFVGNLYKYRNHRMPVFGEELFSEFTLIDKQVYFRDDIKDMIYVSQLLEKGDEVTVNTSVVETFDNPEGLIAVSSKNGKLYVLTMSNFLYVHKNNDLDFVMSFDQFADEIYTNSMFIELKEKGFDWRSRAIYEWIMCDNVPEGLCNRRFLTQNIIHAFYALGKVILTANSYNINLSYKPNYQIKGLEDLQEFYGSKPTRIIDLHSLLYDHVYRSEVIKQLDIIESGSSHKIIILTQTKQLSQRLYVLEIGTADEESCSEKVIMHSRSTTHQNKKKKIN